MNGELKVRSQTVHQMRITPTSSYSLLVTAPNVVLKNLQLEAARGALTLDGADSLVADNLVIWSGFGAAVFSNGGSNNVTIKNSSLLHDTPYWVAWSDCKEGSAPCEGQKDDGSGGMRDAMIEAEVDDTGWILDHNLIRGGHDGIRSTDGNATWTVRYNVFSDFADDPIELEGIGVGTFKIYGNYFTNSLNCLAVGQPVNSNDPNSTRIDGPIYYYSNICSLARIPFVDRFRKSDGSCCFGNEEDDEGCLLSWSGERRYGNEGAFKIGPSNTAVDTHIYQNTVFLVDSHPDKGIHFLGDDAISMSASKVFNNLFVKTNGRVGESDYHTGETSKIINRNLYWKMNDDNAALIASQNYVGTGSTLCNSPGWECQGVGGDPNHLYVGSNPVFHSARLYPGKVEGIGCLGGACDGIDESTSSRWAIRPGSEFVEPELFIPQYGNSPACGAGWGDPNGTPWPTLFPTDHVVDPNGALSKETIGAVPCSNSDSVLASWRSQWNSFPFNQIWTTSTMASASAPVATITEPAEDPYEIICPGWHTDFCAEKTDTDGGAPYTYSWTFSALSGGPCPSTKTDLCPQDVTFSYPAECLVTLTVWDRWLKVDTDQMTVNVGEVCRP